MTHRMGVHALYMKFKKYKYAINKHHNEDGYSSNGHPINECYKVLQFKWHMVLVGRLYSELQHSFLYSTLQ